MTQTTDTGPADAGAQSGSQDAVMAPKHTTYPAMRLGQRTFDITKGNSMTTTTTAKVEADRIAELERRLAAITTLQSVTEEQTKAKSARRQGLRALLSLPVVVPLLAVALVFELTGAAVELVGRGLSGIGKLITRGGRALAGLPED